MKTGNRSRTANSLPRLVAIAAIMALAAAAGAQDWVRPDISQMQRIDLRHLGYPLVNEIPENSSAITALVTASDGKIYGGTTGEQAYLFFFDPSINKVRHMGRIGAEEAVYHSVVEAGEGQIFIGTALDPFTEFPVYRGGLGRQVVEETIWRDIRNHYSGYAGGRLFRYDPATGNRRVKTPDMQADLADLGIPLAGNSIHALTASPDGKTLYGLTYPDGHFFVHDIATGKTTDLGTVDSNLVFHGPQRHWRSLPRALVCDSFGNVYTSGANGHIVIYNPRTGGLEKTSMLVPGDRYPGEDDSYAVVECFTRTADGSIYGGSSDGYLFVIEPKGGRTLRNLGKPRSERRMRAITSAGDGKVYMLAGERSATRYCQMFSWDTYRGGYEQLGVLVADRSPHYYRRGYQFDAMTTGTDGTLYIGESERRSSLFLYIP